MGLCDAFRHRPCLDRLMERMHGVKLMKLPDPTAGNTQNNLFTLSGMPVNG